MPKGKHSVDGFRVGQTVRVSTGDIGIIVPTSNKVGPHMMNVMHLDGSIGTHITAFFEVLYDPHKVESPS